MEGMNRTASLLGRLGGLSRSEAKQEAARRNGARGGRPRAAHLFARDVLAMQERLRPRLPGVSENDLGVILSCVLRPIEQRRFFLRAVRGHYVF